jgi:large subunit ribosomal protein L24
MDKIRTKDEVIVVTGKDKGKRGIVIQRVDADHIVVDGINVAKKAVKPNPMTGTTGGIVDKVMPIHISNVALFNAATGKADRVGIKTVDGKRVRVYKSSGEAVKA